MSKSLKFYIGLLILLIGFIFLIETTTEKPINWNKTYNEKHKSPYGTFVIHNELESIFPESEIETFDNTIYEFLDGNYNFDEDEYKINGTIVQIEEYATIDGTSAEELLYYVSLGNTAFLASNTIPEIIKDSLKIDTKTSFSFKGKATFKLVNPKFKSDSIHLKKGANNVYFKKLDSNTTTVLGTQTFNDSTYVNFAKVNYGSGSFIFHLQPVTFTNYNILKVENQTYIEAALGYIPDNNIYYKSKNKPGKNLGNSKLRFILSKKALRYGWYLGLISLLLFIIFNAKRKQRIVKVITPHKNTTVAFIKTIGNLYYETKDHNNLITKKITYFLEYVRRTYFVDTQILDDKFVKNLALKANKKPQDLKILVNKIAYLRAKRECTEQDLLDLNALIEDFYNS
jgi:hypothetical protein